MQAGKTGSMSFLHAPRRFGSFPGKDLRHGGW